MHTHVDAHTHIHHCVEREQDESEETEHKIEIEEMKLDDFPHFEISYLN